MKIFVKLKRRLYPVKKIVDQLKQFSTEVTIVNYKENVA